MRSGVQSAIHVQPRTGDLPGGRAGEEGKAGDTVQVKVKDKKIYFEVKDAEKA